MMQMKYVTYMPWNICHQSQVIDTPYVRCFLPVKVGPATDV